MTTPETTTQDEFDSWFADRPKWLQTAAAKMLQSPRQDGDFIDAMAKLCHGEASKTADLPFEKLPKGAFGQPPAPFDMRLDEISGVKGLNAIHAGAKIKFDGGNLTIIFGPNGVGKSGFARLLKHASGARHKSDLLPNVFDLNGSAPTAQFRVTRNGKQDTFNWTAGDQALKALRYVHIFDSATATEYVTAKNEAAYETRRLRFISSLIEVCDKVADILTENSGKLVSRLPVLPTDLSQSFAGDFLRKLTHKTTTEAIERACSFTSQDMADRITLETTLAETNVEGKLKEVLTLKNQLGNIETTLNELKVGYSSEKLEALVRAGIDSSRKRSAADDAAQKVFANAPLDGVASDSWRQLWECARIYSEQAAFKEIPFPNVNVGAHCVLCQQPLSEDARTRLVSFEEFVKGSLEAEAKRAVQLHQQLVNAFPRIPERADWEALLFPLKLEERIGEVNFQALILARNQIGIANPETPLTPLNWIQLDEALAAAKDQAVKQEKVLIDSQDQEKRLKMQRQLLDLKGREWLNQQKPAIADELTRKRALVTFDEARKLANTRSLTAKKNELMASELTQGYQKRFAEELQYLGGKRIPVVPIAISQGKGKVSFQVKLRGAVTKEGAHNILSEGEHRIVALAAFLADMRGLGFPTPFVFDDPISSLDQDYEERVVARLVELAKDRQVIVFTHRLSLVTLLQEAITNAGENPPQVEALLRVGNHIGVPDALKIRHQKPQTGFAAMQQSLATLRKLEEAGDFDALENRLNVACTDFRILLEKAVETCLLNEIVLRFRRGIQTLGRLEKLLVITPDDIRCIDGMMSKYSVYEHSQPDELPAQTVTVDELAADIQTMIEWMAAFKKKKPA